MMNLLAPTVSTETLQGAAQLRCPCCGAAATHQVYEALSVPVHSCILLGSREEARSFTRRDLRLAHCETCGFVFNFSFDEAAMRYSTDFEESQHFSGTFNSFAKTLAGEIAQKCAVAGRHVLEVGCGKGEFLRELCKQGNATGLGIDPGYRKDAGRNDGDENIDFIVDLFGPKYKNLSADVVLCRHTLEHIAAVAGFVRNIREMIGARADTCVVFETPDVKRVLEEGAFWDIYYEHCSYFSPGTHARLFRQEGFDVTDLSLVYDGQYILQYATPTTRPTIARLPLEKDLEQINALADRFNHRVSEVKNFWSERVRRGWQDGRRIVLWGGGSKGVSFLTTLGLTQEVAAVVDINPYKQGKFVPATGHEVIAPTALSDIRPDLVIVMNPIYENEVAANLRAMNLRSEVIALKPHRG
jgi:SAM-dependent methyltransferase